MQNSFLRLPDVKQRTGLSRASIYAMINNGDFPKQTVIGRRAVAWSSKSIQEWIDQRIKGGQAK
ncbi:MAG: AlpA family transcriptional regulator [Opitutae bacterium]